MKAFTTFIVVTLFTLSLSQNASAQCQPVGSGTGGNVLCLYHDTVSHHLYVGGGFHYAGNDTLNYCGYWNDTLFHHMGNWPYGTNDSVWCFAYWNGNLCVGGSFTQAGGMTANHIAMWNGSTWSSPGSGLNGAAYAMAEYNGKLYVAGNFSMAGGQGANYLACWDGTQWSQPGGGLNGPAYALCAWGGDLYIGGGFTMAGGMAVNRICLWNGSAFMPIGGGFNPGMMGQGGVYTLCPYQGHMYAGGMFQVPGMNGMQNIAMWNGSGWSSIGNVSGGMSGNSRVHAMQVYNGKLFVGGMFGSCGGNAAQNIGVWNGSGWSTIGTGMNDVVMSLSEYDSKLILGGAFTNASGTTVSNLASYDETSGIQSFTTATAGLTVFPNPASDQIECRWSQERPAEAVLYVWDASGRLVMREALGTLGRGPQQFYLPVGSWDNGIYRVVVDTGDSRFSQPIVVSR